MKDEIFEFCHSGMEEITYLEVTIVLEKFLNMAHLLLRNFH